MSFTKDDCRTEIQKYDKEQEQESRKKKKRTIDSDDDDSDDNGSSSSSSTRKKKKAKLSKPDKEDDSNKITYRDRAKERRKGASGIEDVTAYLQKNVVKQQIQLPSSTTTVTDHKRKASLEENNSTNNPSSSSRRKKSKKTTQTMGDRVLKVLQRLNLGQSIVSSPSTNQWLEGNIVYHYNVHPNPVTYDIQETPTVVTSSAAAASSTSSTSSSSSKSTILTDRQKNPALPLRLLNMLDLAMERASRGLSDPHPSSIKRREREQLAKIEQKKEIERKLIEKKKEIDDMMNNSTHEISASSTSKHMTTSMQGSDEEEDDIFADAGEYVAMIEEEDDDDEEQEQEQEQNENGANVADSELEILPPQNSITPSNAPVVMSLSFTFAFFDLVTYFCQSS